MNRDAGRRSSRSAARCSGPLRQDTNSLWLAARLEEIGTAVVRKSIVGDDPDGDRRRARPSRRSAADLVVHDRRPRTHGRRRDGRRGRALARRGPSSATPRSSRRCGGASSAAGIRDARRSTRSRRTSSSGPASSQNPSGTAPGFWAEEDGVEIVVLPGVPSEMREIMEDSVLPELARARRRRRRAAPRPADRRHGRVGRRRARRARLREVEGRSRHDPGLARARSSSTSPRAGSRRGGRAAPGGDGGRFPRGPRRLAIFGEDGEDLRAAVGRLLRERWQTLALAESCTGGMIASLADRRAGLERLFPGRPSSPTRTPPRRACSASPKRRCARTAPSREQAALEMARGRARAVRRRRRRLGDGDRRARTAARRRSPSAPCASPSPTRDGRDVDGSGVSSSATAASSAGPRLCPCLELCAGTLTEGERPEA